MNSKLKKKYKIENDILGIPQDYKGLKIYPIKVFDFEYRDLFYEIMTYPKHQHPSPEVIRMSYLKFLIAMDYSSGNSFYADRIIKILQYVTREDAISFGHKNKGPGDFDIFIRLGGLIEDKIHKDWEFEISEIDFDNIREIILQQNGLSIEWVNQYDPEMEKHLIASNRNNDITPEDEIWIFCSLTDLPTSQIDNYTVYQFRKHLERKMHVANYFLYTPIEGSLKASGALKPQAELVKHYFCHLGDRGRYDSIIIEESNFLRKNPDIQDREGNVRNPEIKNKI